ncbi:hypothetical protein EUX98_g685 [Antrodiella citrinella]|uniref:Uncharacterized protein n=1 Tax=Antrodiella citrinella TaxID=2447956 RepID=A0A4S4N688_9APHY|nr:hypothetical protein EUX98_g685 [Antrodiella citrinella]
MEKGAVAQRKLSRGKSMQSTRGLFSRKTIKKADSQILTQTLSSSTVVGDDRASIATSKGKELERHSLEDNHVPPRPIFAVRSIIPDPLNELPAWYTQAAEGGPITVPQFRSKYPMHNPIGPRCTGPSLASSAEKKEKRGSILGRLAKRFSVMRKPDQNRSSAKVGSIDNRSIMNGRPSIDTLPAAPSRSTPSPQKPSLHHAKSSDVSHRIQPPVLLDEPPTPLSATLPKDNTSLSSFEEPYPIGKLTIANPDEPAPPTPAEDIVPLPPLPPPETGVVADSGTWTEHLNGVLGIPISSSPSQMELPDTPLQHRLSTILSEDAPGTSPSPPLPELPPVTPSIVARVITEPSLPPTPEGTRPPTPEPRPVSYTPATPKSRPMSHTPATPESRPISRTPASPAMSNGTQARNALSYAMSPSSLSVFHSSLPSIDDLPLSRASLVVEPPTPHAPVLLIPAQAHASPMPSPEQVLQSNGDSPTQRDPSPSKRDSGRVKGSSSSTKSRRTETFKLIRSSSGNVHTVGESIMVEGEHWEVVADEKKSRKERSKSSEGEATPSKKEKESKKAERIASDDASDKKMRDRHRKSVNDKPNSDHAGRSSTYSEDTVRQSTSERRRSTTKERNRDSNGDVVRSTQTPVTPPMPSKSTSTRRERRTSSSTTRPSSEFQSAADINALKAKEAWDLERMWKGRSMVYGPDGTTVISNRPTIGSDSRPSTIMSHDLHRATSIPSVGDLQRASTMPASHGSSHTYFMVQTPTNGASSYEQIPVPVQPTKSTTTRNDYTLYRSFTDSVPFPTNSQAGALPNPLPDPPRLSVYTAAPLPPSLVGSGDGPSSSEYWTKYAGVSTTNH